MKHLQYLELANYMVAAFYAAIGVATVPLCLILFHLFAVDVPPDEVVMVYLALGVGVGMCLAFALFAYVMGRRVAEGRWRGVQSVWAVLTAANNPPAGLVYGAYALWVCWGNDETRAMFDRA